MIGMAWLYALHARSGIARGRVRQAEYMISGMRDHVLALACLRHELPTVHGREFDALPSEAAAIIERSLVSSLQVHELKRARLRPSPRRSWRRLSGPTATSRHGGPLRELAS